WHGLLAPVGYAQNFFHGSNAIQDLLNAVGMDTRAVAARLTFQFQLPSPFVDLGADGFSNLYHLVNPYPAPVAQLIAMLTAFSPENGRRIGGVLLQELAVLVGRDIGLTAVITQHPNQTLRHDADQTGGNQEGFYTHIHQAGNGTHRGIGVQG